VLPPNENIILVGLRVAVVVDLSFLLSLLYPSTHTCHFTNTLSILSFCPFHLSFSPLSSTTHKVFIGDYLLSPTQCVWACGEMGVDSSSIRTMAAACRAGSLEGVRWLREESNCPWHTAISESTALSFRARSRYIYIHLFLPFLFSPRSSPFSLFDSLSLHR
jgi:hypothetical protein